MWCKGCSMSSISPEEMIHAWEALPSLRDASLAPYKLFLACWTFWIMDKPSSDGKWTVPQVCLIAMGRLRKVSDRDWGNVCDGVGIIVYRLPMTDQPFVWWWTSTGEKSLVLKDRSQKYGNLGRLLLFGMLHLPVIWKGLTDYWIIEIDEVSCSVSKK